MLIFRLFNRKTTTTKFKSPTPLPSLVASNISRAVYRLLRALENEHEFGERNSQPVSNASDRLPRIQPESKAEREFADVGTLLRATTVATNAILERKGASTGLITTAGFRDVFWAPKLKFACTAPIRKSFLAFLL